MVIYDHEVRVAESNAYAVGLDSRRDHIRNKVAFKAPFPPSMPPRNEKGTPQGAF